MTENYRYRIETKTRLFTGKRLYRFQLSSYNEQYGIWCVFETSKWHWSRKQILEEAKHQVNLLDAQ